MTDITAPRLYPMRKPAGHCPVIQRYSSVTGPEVTEIRVLVFGQQSQTPRSAEFFELLEPLMALPEAPLHHDFAQYVDPEGAHNIFACCYWQDAAAYRSWRNALDGWLADQDPNAVSCGYWIETFAVPTAYRETIAFQEYLRGLSACPHSQIEPMEESAYWGAARDRFQASAFDPLGPASNAPLNPQSGRDTLRKRIRVRNVPEKLCVIRSGVSWENCGPEQLMSYETNLRPKLDAGMEYLRNNPVDTGCASLRQVRFVDAQGAPQPEAYSLGVFLSFQHLEDWAQFHPTHLAIYTRALAERKKYQDALELKTYHEIYVLGHDTDFTYLNCHPGTGLLPYFDIEEIQ